jgi:hypothetical protein
VIGDASEILLLKQKIQGGGGVEGAWASFTV